MSKIQIVYEIKAVGWGGGGGDKNGQISCAYTLAMDEDEQDQMRDRLW